MSFVLVYDITGITGTYAPLDLWDTGVNFSQIFDGTPQFYPGSQITIEEIVTIQTVITEPHLVDIDKRYFFPLEYRGTWQILPPFPEIDMTEGDTGFITTEVFKIKRYSQYTITANPAVNRGGDDLINIENCNFILREYGIIIPGLGSYANGYLPIDVSPSLIGRLTRQKAPLVDTKFNQKIAGCGIHLNPGVEGVSMMFEITAINTIYTDYPSVPEPTCEFKKGSPCEEKFQIFLQQNQADYASESIGEVGYKCPSCATDFNIWTCPTDPTYKRPYWTGKILPDSQ
jgi:hypothetical protein